MTDTGLEFGELEALKTTNAQDEKWSEWIDWSGGKCPLLPRTFVETKYRNGNISDGLARSYRWDFADESDPTCPLSEEADIIAYRYKIKEPESDMHPDLDWLAREVSGWYYGNLFANVVRWRIDEEPSLYWSSITEDDHKVNQYTYKQWKSARQQLGLDNDGWTPEAIKAAAFTTPEEDEAWQTKERELNRPKYSAYFKDVSHLERIDVYRVVSLFDCEKHGHAISHAVKKLLLTGVRTGGKDVETEVREAIDSLSRWLEMREEDSQ